jgi:hypothetical protein
VRRGKGRVRGRERGRETTVTTVQPKAPDDMVDKHVNAEGE